MKTVVKPVNDGTEEAIRKAVGARIAEARRDLGLNQAQLGALIGVGKITISRYERGVLPIGHQVLANLVDVSGRPASWFFSEDKPATDPPDEKKSDPAPQPEATRILQLVAESRERERREGISGLVDTVLRAVHLCGVQCL